MAGNASPRVFSAMSRRRSGSCGRQGAVSGGPVPGNAGYYNPVLAALPGRRDRRPRPPGRTRRSRPPRRSSLRHRPGRAPRVRGRAPLEPGRTRYDFWRPLDPAGYRTLFAEAVSCAERSGDQLRLGLAVGQAVCFSLSRKWSRTRSRPHSRLTGDPRVAFTPHFGPDYCFRMRLDTPRLGFMRQAGLCITAIGLNVRNAR